MDETVDVDVFEDNGVLMLRYPDGAVEAYDDYLRRTEPGMSYDNATGELIVATPASAEAAAMPGGETAPDVFGDTTARMARPYLETAADLAASAGRRPTYFENPLMQGVERTGQYIGDMGLAGLNAVMGGMYGGAGLLGEAFGGDTQDERRLARDLAAMIDTAGPAPEGRMLGLLGGSPTTQAAGDTMRAIGRDVVERLNQPGQMPTTYANPIPGLRLFHGSPHDFDRFSMSKIGTGEGAQAYGHGLYFAEAEDVARGYRDRLGIPRDKYGAIVGGSVRNHMRTMVDGVDAKTKGQDFWEVAEQLAHRNIPFDDYLADLREKMGWMSSEAGQKRFADEIAKAEQFAPELRGASIAYEQPGRMYEVEINANPEDFLDWDKPLSEQTPKIQGIWGRYTTRNPRWKDPERVGSQYENPTGSDFLGAYSEDVQHDPNDFYNYQRKFTEDLSRLGVPGIRYLDQGSRGASEGSRNYVVFDENLVNIVRKYGVAGAAAMLGMSQADVAQATQQQQQPQGLLSMGAQ